MIAVPEPAVFAYLIIPLFCRRRGSVSEMKCAQNTDGYFTRMNQDRIIEMLRNQPFKPFEVRISEGRVYEVEHPDFIARSHDGRSITFYISDDRMMIIDTARIVALEIANRPAA